MIHSRVARPNKSKGWEGVLIAGAIRENQGSERAQGTKNHPKQTKRNPTQTPGTTHHGFAAMKKEPLSNSCIFPSTLTQVSAKEALVSIPQS